MRRWMKEVSPFFSVGVAWLAGGLCYGESLLIALPVSIAVGGLSAICLNVHDSVINKEDN